MGWLSDEVITELLAGTIGGCAGIAVSQPFDVLKVRQQSCSMRAAAPTVLPIPAAGGTASLPIIGTAAHPLPTTGTGAHGSLIGELIAGVRRDGIVSLYRGIGPPLVANGALNAILFASYGQALRWLNVPHGGDVPVPGYASFLAGSYGGVWTAVISVPTELLKVRQQVEVGRAQTSALHIARGIVAEKGFTGLYRGGIATFARDSWSYGVYFWVYNEFNKLLVPAWGRRKDGTTAPVGEAAAVCVSGGTAGVIGWAVCYPIDTVKTMIQTAEHTSKGSPLTEWFRLLMATPRSKLWCGFGACVARTLPMNSVTFLCYEYSVKIMRSRRLGTDASFV
eukprot:m.55745 g.55745  ORF g.55745 m.55745 type:complete len:337 (+) comp7623_c0_seq1:446-1456(+)